MDKKYTYEQILEKLVLAKAKISGIPRKQHRITCPEEDPESYAPCNCGAMEHNKPLDEAVELLKL